MNNHKNANRGAGVLSGFLLLLLILGCVSPHPLITSPEVREKLSNASTFEPKDVVTEKPISVEKAREQQQEQEKKDAQKKEEKPVFKLTLQQARKYALENNLDLKVEWFNPAISEQLYLAEKAKFEAVMGATANFSEEKDFRGDPTRIVSAGPSLSVPTKAGGIVSLGLPYAYQEIQTTDTEGKTSKDITHTQGFKIGISQPLLRNSGWEHNYASIDISGLQLRQSDSRLKLAVIRLLANTEDAYWQYYAAYQSVIIEKRQYELTQKQVTNSFELVDKRVRPEAELTRAQSGSAKQYDSVIRAETLRRQLERSLKRFINLPDLPLESKTIIIPVEPLSPQRYIFDREKVIKLAYKERMELFENELQLAIDKISINVADRNKLPDLLLDFSYTFSGSDRHLDKALDKMFKDEFNSYSVGLSFEFPIGNQAAISRHRESLIKRQQTEANRKVQKMIIRQEVLNAIDAVEQNWLSILASYKAEELSKKTYEADLREFSSGAITSTEVLNSLSSLSDAEYSTIQALSDYQRSLVDLAFASGTVLGKIGLFWK